MDANNLFFQSQNVTPVQSAPPLPQLKKQQQARPNLSLHVLRQRCWREPAAPAAAGKGRKGWEAECDALALIRNDKTEGGQAAHTRREAESRSLTAPAAADSRPALPPLCCPASVSLVGFKGSAEVFSVQAAAVVEVEHCRDVKAVSSKSGKAAVSFGLALGSPGLLVVCVDYDSPEEKRAVTQFLSRLSALKTRVQSATSDRPADVPTRAQVLAELKGERAARAKQASPRKKPPAAWLADSSSLGYQPTQPKQPARPSLAYSNAGRGDETMRALQSGQQQRSTERRYTPLSVGRPGLRTIQQETSWETAEERYERGKAAAAETSALSSPRAFTPSSSSSSIGANSFRSGGAFSSSAHSYSSGSKVDVLNDADSFSPSHRDSEVRLNAPYKPVAQLLPAKTGGSSMVTTYCGSTQRPWSTSSSYSVYGSKPSSFSSSSSSSQSSSFFPSSSSLSARPRHSGEEIGMRNVGNNCWLIAVVQALFAQRAFTVCLQRPLPVPLPPRCLYSSLLQLLTQHGEKAHGVLDPLPLKRAVGERLQRFAGSRQQDAHEFLMEALNAVTEDIVEAFLSHWRRQTAAAAVSADSNGHSDAMLVESEVTEVRGSKAMTPPPPSSRPASSPLLAPVPPRSRTEDDAISVESGGSDKENRSPPPPPLPLAPPPVELLKAWQQQADRLSASHSSFHCEVEVTLTCLNADCQYSRKNVEHFNVLSLDLPEQQHAQTSLDGWMRPAASVAAAPSSSYGRSSAASLPFRSPGSLAASSSSSSSSSSASSSSHHIPDLPHYLTSSTAPHSNGSSKTAASASSASSSALSSSLPSPSASSSFSASSSSSSSAVSSAASRLPPARAAVSMVSLLRQFFSPMHQEYKCERCQHAEVEITSAISRLPRVLILHIKRFTPDQRSGTYEKRQDPVLVQRTIDLSFACKDDVELPEQDPQLDAAVAPLSAALAAAAEPRRSVSPAANGWDDDDAMVDETPVTARSPRAATTPSSGSSSPSARLDSAASAPRVSVSPPAVSPSSSASAVVTPSSTSSKRSRVSANGASAPLLSPTSALAASAQVDSESDSARKRSRMSPSQFSSVKRDKWEERRVQIELEYRRKESALKEEYRRRKQGPLGGTEEDDIDMEYCVKCSELTAAEESRKAEVEKLKEEETETKRRTLAAAAERRKVEAEQRRLKEMAGDAEQGDPPEAEAEDEVLKRVLEESKQEAEKPRSREAEDDEQQLQAAITASMQDLHRRRAEGEVDVGAASESELLRASESASPPPQPQLPGSPQQQPVTPTSIATTVSPVSDASMLSCPQSPQSSKSASPPPPASSSFPSCSSSLSSSRAVYSLRGLVLHKGESSSSGHYIADLLLPEAEGEGSGRRAVWKRFDDQWVDVLKVEDDRTRRTWEKEGYILFFQLQQRADSNAKHASALPTAAAVDGVKG